MIRRNVLLAVLMFLMLTPSMVCFMSFCPAQAQIRMSAAEKIMPCHGDQVRKDKSDAAHFPMLAKDCMKNDLGQASFMDVPLPSGDFLILSFVLSGIFFRLQMPARLRFSGTGPPVVGGRPSFQRLLLTQRFRQ